MRPLYLPIPDDSNAPDGMLDNPHVCILEDLPCLTCTLIAALGPDRRTEALDIASRMANVRCDWGRTNGFVDCVDSRNVTMYDDYAFCDVHHDVVTGEGLPEWFADEMAKDVYLDGGLYPEKAKLREHLAEEHGTIANATEFAELMAQHDEYHENIRRDRA